MKKINNMLAHAATILSFLLAALASGVEANQPPVCESVYSKPDSIWPPNNAFKKIKIYGITDPDGDDINVAVQCIRQDEPVVDSHDATGIGRDDPSLRRSRDDSGNGRVYYIEFLATDSHGAYCTGTLNVQLPLAKGGDAIGEGPIYDSVPQQSGCADTHINNPPSISSFPVINATATLDYQYDVDATDPDGDVLVYRLVQSPEGMSIDSQSGLISWRPMESHLGGHEVEIEVADDGGLTDTQLFLLTVSLAPNQPPTIISEPVISGRAELEYRYDVEASDADQDLLVYHLDVFPVGMIIDDASGLVTWTPDAAQAGDHEVVVRVEDVRGDSASQTFTLHILPPNSAPVIISDPITGAIATQPYNYKVLATDADGDALAFSLSQAPVGMLIDASSGEISWVPDEHQTGSHSVDILVEDSLGGFATQLYFISVAPKPNNPPSIVSQPVTEVLVGMLYSYNVEAEDPDTDEVLTFALSTAPTGMTAMSLS